MATDGAWSRILGSAEGRAHIHLRTWNKHTTKLVLYLSKRFFVIPIENAKALADALCRATAGWPDEKPDWLVAREEAEEEKPDVQDANMR